MAQVTGIVGANREQHQQHRQLRQELREHKQNIHRNKEVLCDANSNRLQESLVHFDKTCQRADALGDAFRKPKDVSTQAEIFRTLAGYGVEASNKLVQQQQGRGPMELVRALRARFVHTRDPQLDGEEDPMAFCWHELTAATEHLRRPARGMHCILGALDAKPKERKAPAQQRQKKQELGAVTKPEMRDTIPIEDVKETDRNMETMWQIIKGQPGQTATVAKLVCNRASYGQTIENLFTLSFLLRDSRVGMKKVPGVGLVVWALDGKRGEAASKHNSKPPLQFVITLHQDDWARMCSRVAAAECLMPHRDNCGHKDVGPSGPSGKRRASNGPEPSGGKRARRAE